MGWIDLALCMAMFDAVYFTFFWAHLKRLGRFGALVIACANVSMPVVFFMPLLAWMMNCYVCQVNSSTVLSAMIFSALAFFIYYLTNGRYKRVIFNRKYAERKYRLWSWCYFLLTFVWLFALYVHAIIRIDGRW